MRVLREPRAYAPQLRMGSGTYEDMGTSGIKTDDASPHFSLQHFFQQRLVRRRLPRPNRLRNPVSFLSRFCNASVKVSAHARLAALERRVAPTHRPARPSHSVCGPLLRFEEPPFGSDPFGCPNSSLLGSKLPSTVCQKLFFFPHAFLLLPTSCPVSRACGSPRPTRYCYA